MGHRNRNLPPRSREETASQIAEILDHPGWEVLYNDVILKHIKDIRRNLLQNDTMSEVEHKANVMKLQFMRAFLEDAYIMAGWGDLIDAFAKDFE